MKNKKSIIKIALASALGLGLSPILPGTCGALLGVVIHVAIYSFLPINLQWGFLVLAFIAVCWGNNALTPWAVNYWGDKDPKEFVLDEVAGYLLVPILFTGGELWKVALWGFLLFRIFDIFKIIPPAKWIDQNMPGAWGILLDDLVSAVGAVIVIYCLYKINPALLMDIN